MNTSKPISSNSITSPSTRKGKFLCRLGLHKWDEVTYRKPFEPKKCLRDGCKGLYEFSGMLGYYCGAVGSEEQK